MSMFAELIYTRCRQGIDILTGRSVSSGGFNVYACTPSLLETGNTDLRFLLNVAQGKQSYNDPDFMDDAYLYFVMDNGDGAMVEFHPIPLDKTATGSYSHRSGNYLNQVLTGDFSGFYPFELFKDSAVWNAKARGEAYYYENAPTALPPRDDISDPSGPFGIDEIGAFISDGREEALMRAVSFLIAQYELPPEERKFLVVRDDSSEKIEMWIAAIEYAFSPRMAAAAPFATRMDKFAATNRYAVNQMGVYQPQINFQDKNQKFRYRAMIVGVDERDRANFAAARPSANSTFVLLDGKEKKAMFDADISNRYFRFITGFDDAHQTFCREFLQMIDIATPSAELYELLDIYLVFENLSLPNAENMARIAITLGKYKLFNSGRLQKLYTRVNAEFSRFLREDIRNSIQIAKWLQAISRTVGDAGAAGRLSDIVYTAFAEQVYEKSDPDGTLDFWRDVKNSEFAATVADRFVDPSALRDNRNRLQLLKFSEAIVFLLVYLDCAALTGTVGEQDIQNAMDWGLKKCCAQRDKDSARELLKILSRDHRVDIGDMLFSIAGNAESDYAAFIMEFIIEYDKSIVATDASMMNFLKKLSAAGTEHLYAAVIKLRIRLLTRPADIEQFIKLIKKIPSLNDRDLAEIFETLDSRLAVSDKGAVNAALTVQRERPKDAACVKSAHIYALEVLNDKRARDQLTSIYDALAKQGFPSETDPDYIRALVEKLFKAQPEPKELIHIVRLFARVPAYMSELAGAILGMTTSKRNDEWNVLMTVVAKTRDHAISDAIAQECAKLKQGEKALAQLSDMLRSKEARDCFRDIAEHAKGIIRSQKAPSGFGRFFGGKS
jgi:hypothetical protein